MTVYILSNQSKLATELHFIKKTEYMAKKKGGKHLLIDSYLTRGSKLARPQLQCTSTWLLVLQIRLMRSKLRPDSSHLIVGTQKAFAHSVTYTRVAVVLDRGIFVSP